MQVPHFSHYSLSEALELVRRLQPARTLIIGMTCDMGACVRASLQPGRNVHTHKTHTDTDTDIHTDTCCAFRVFFATGLHDTVNEELAALRETGESKRSF
jgi:hypothetical protein